MIEINGLKSSFAKASCCKCSNTETVRLLMQQRFMTARNCGEARGI
ncbi:hypothetical protein L584_15320 [Pantoea agglomerans Tx10]|nr:hypothetical protein L584_15320 [Pantoea agglomerans Tx10]